MRKLAFLLPCILAAGCAAPPKSIVQPHSINGAMPPLGQHDPRVVFMGDSVLFTMVAAAKNPLWINAATNGPETTGSMLARFQSDVVNQHPDVVVILGGTYDTLDPEWSNGGSPNADTDTATNIYSMAGLAIAANIHLIVGTVPLQSVPVSGALVDVDSDILVYDFYVLDQQANDPNTPPNVLQKATIVDYEGISQDETWTTNGTDPNASGSQLMAAATQDAITECQCGGIR